MTLFRIIVVLVLIANKCKGGVEDNLVESVDFPYCDSLLKEIPSRQVESPVPLRKADVRGKWVSQSCETRPGFVHVTRSYDFETAGRLRLLLHLYTDSFCIKPKMSIQAEGHIALKRRSLTTPGGTEADYYIEKMSLIPHSHKAIFELTNELNRTSCPATIVNSIKQHHVTTLFQSPMSVNEIEVSTLSCIPSMFQTWNELQLVRVEIAPETFWKKSSCRRRELYLGDLHSNPKRQPEYRPTSYQVSSLVNTACIEECATCSLVNTSSFDSPPTFKGHNRVRVPGLLLGSWASRRCEVQRHGLFLTRKLTFKSTRPRWSIKQRYFYDPNCRNATYTILASGTYKKIPAVSLSQTYGDAVDMAVRRMNIVPDDKNFAAQLNRIPGRICGVSGLWRTNRGQDLTPTGGCKPIGLIVPSKEPEIMRMDSGKNGEIFLTLGQTPTWSHRGVGPAPRPTAWGPPLQKCSPLPEPDNHLLPVVGARVSMSGGNSLLENAHLTLLFILPSFALH